MAHKIRLSTQILVGASTKNQLAWVLLPMTFIMMACWLISRILYGGYVWDRHVISNQGSLTENPIGCWFFIVGSVIAAFNIALLIIYVFRRIWGRFRWLSILFLLSGLTGAFGLFLVAITPEGSGRLLIKIHGWGAGLAFAGLWCAAGLSMLIGIIRMATKEPWPTPIQFFCLLGLVFNTGSMMFFSQSGSLVQWTAFHTILIWLIGLFLIAPENSDGNRSAK